MVQSFDILAGFTNPSLKVRRINRRLARHFSGFRDSGTS